MSEIAASFFVLYSHMRILFIAPEPFFENRGTPIAVRNMLRVIGGLGHRIDLVTYYSGENVSLPATTIYRCLKLPFRNIPIGFSPLKLLLDLLLYLVVVRRLLARRYDVIHCVEEGIYLALLAAPPKDSALCYDMDSSLSEQLTARGRTWRLFAPMFRSLEKWAIRKSTCIVTVCPALTEYARTLGGRKPIFQIEDTPVVPRESLSAERRRALREHLALGERKAVVYIGNLESYQGIDLLLKAFALVIQEKPDAALIVVGGDPRAVLAKKSVARSLGLERNVVFTGFVLPNRAAPYLSLADIVVSPRTRGTNFPMKVYSYLASGKPLLATNLPVHRQVLTRKTAFLATPTPEGLAQGIIQLLGDSSMRRSLAEAGRDFVEREYNEEAYRRKVEELYRWIAARAAARSGREAEKAPL